MELKDISFVIPAYNEEKYIEDTVNKVNNFLSKKSDNFEIIAIDDGSADHTHSILLKLSGKISNLKVFKNSKNIGKGYSVRKGVLSAYGKYIVFSDSDLSVPIDELDKFLEYLKKGENVVIGSRAIRGSDIIRGQNFIRKNMGRTFNLLINIFLFKGIKDTQCGFKGFSEEAAKKIFNIQQIDGFCFDAEVLCIAKKLKYKIIEIPVKWINRKDSRVSIVKSSLRMFSDIFRIKMNDARGLYG